MEIVDTHIHLYAEDYISDRDSLIQKALRNGIRRFYLPNIDSTSIPAMLELEKDYPAQCFAMMGLHPCSVNEKVNDELATVKKWLDMRPFSGIGEIGIDLYWDKTYFKEQQMAFLQQVQWALDYNYPVVIHVRQALSETIELLKTFKTLPVGIFHCFSGTLKEAEEVLSLGSIKLGIGGVVTFKNSGLDQVVQQIDSKHLVLETDGPYLAPVPFRGKRNEPSYILEVAKKVAELKGLDLEEVALITTNNAEEIFKKA